MRERAVVGDQQKSERVFIQSSAGENVSLAIFFGQQIEDCLVVSVFRGGNYAVGLVHHDINIFLIDHGVVHVSNAILFGINVNGEVLYGNAVDGDTADTGGFLLSERLAVPVSDKNLSRRIKNPFFK